MVKKVRLTFSFPVSLRRRSISVRGTSAYAGEERVSTLCKITMSHQIFVVLLMFCF